MKETAGANVSESIQYVLIGAGRVVIAPAQLPVRTAARTVLLLAERRVNKSKNPPRRSRTRWATDVMW